MNPSVRVLSLAAVCVPLLLLSACQRAQDAAVEAALERATGTELEVKDGGKQMTIKTEQGDLKIASAEAGGSVALPPDFPGDIYLPREHRVDSAIDMAGMQMVNLTSPAGLQPLYDEVGKSMTTQGWKREMTMQEEGGATLMYSKDERQVIYQLVKGDGGTQVALRTGTNR